MRRIYFDCFSGASGDMIAGALLDAGLSLDALREGLGRLGLPGWRIEASRVTRGGIAGTKFDVVIDEKKQEYRRLGDVLRIIGESGLSNRVKSDAERIFQRLAEVEAKVHGIGVGEVHFHEVGAVDAIVDVAAAAIGLEELGIEEVAVSALPTGSGFVECAHGRLPIPAPATAELLKGFPAAASGIEAELTTPTGAAVLTTLGRHSPTCPPMKVTSVGYGAGASDFKETPNLLRVIIGESDAPLETDRMWVIETNIDDMPAELFEGLFERLFAAEVMDVFTTPIQMKKGRPAVKLSVVVSEDLRARAEEIIFRETTTFGIRAYQVDRRKLSRESVGVRTDFGEVTVKLGRLHGELITVSPEYEHCKRVADERGVTLKEVYEKARSAAQGLT